MSAEQEKLVYTKEEVIALIKAIDFETWFKSGSEKYGDAFSLYREEYEVGWSGFEGALFQALGTSKYPLGTPDHAV